MTAASHIRALLLLGLLACVSAPALAAIGTVQFAAGEVQIRDAAGNLRPLRKGDSVEEGEAIVTGAFGSAQLRMIDGGILAIRPDTDLKLDQYRYAGREDGSEGALMSLVKGGFRTITGFIGRVNKSRYRITTPTATVGIRGTDHEPFFIPPGSRRGGADPGTYDKVNDGIAFIASAGVEQNIGKNQMGYAAPNQPPVLLPVLPELFKATPPVQKPAAQKPGAEAPAEEAPAATPPPPPPPAEPAAAPETQPSTEIVQAIEATATCTDATGNTIACDANLTTQTVAAGGTEVPIAPGAIGTLTPLQDSGSTYDHIVIAPGLFEAPVAPQPASSYSTDAAGNVVSFASAETGSKVEFSGGVARDSFVSPDIRLGRWEGGSYTHTNEIGTQTFALGSASAHWIFALQPPPGLVQRYSGSVGYAPFAHTSPTDALGNVGVLNGAGMTVDFDLQKVDAEVNLTIAGRTLEGAVPGMPIGGNFFGGSANAACSGSGCDGSYSVYMDGALAGAAGTKATLAYDFAGASTDVVSGAVAFQAGGAPQIADANAAALAASSAAAAASDAAAALTSMGNPTLAAQAQAAADQANAAAAAVNTGVSGVFASTSTTGAQQALTSLDAAVANAIAVAQQTAATLQALFGTVGTGVSFAYIEAPVGGGDIPRADSLTAPSVAVVLEGGNLRTAVELEAFEPIEGGEVIDVVSGTPSGPTPANSGTGITFGRWSNATVGGQDHEGPFTREVIGDFHWIKGPELSPFFLTEAITGTFSYKFDGGSVTDEFGTPGTFSAATTFLTADFTRQALDIGLDFTLPARSPGTSPRHFVAQADDIVAWGDGFWAGSHSTAPHQNLSVWLNASTTSAPNGYGNLSGQFSGAGAGGAMMTFSLAGFDPLNCPDFICQHERATGAAAFVHDPAGSIGSPSFHIGLVGTGLVPNADLNATEERTKYLLELGVNGAGRVTYSGDMPVAFDGFVPVYVPVPPECSTCRPFVSDIPARFVVQSPTAILDGGADVETGMRWGRYAGGPIAVVDRISGATLGAIDTTLQNVHFAISGLNSGPVVLPVTGMANYALIGHTSPTDNFGNVGTLGSAALAVDFASQRVASSVNLSIGGNTWAASTPALAAGGVPIYKGTAFFAEKALSGAGNLTVTVNGSATGTAGNLGGVFTGATGQGAAVGYSLLQSIASPTTVTGVAVFKRP